MSMDKSLLDEFISESKEHLSTIEEDFISLEKNGASDLIPGPNNRSSCAPQSVDRHATDSINLQ